MTSFKLIFLLILFFAATSTQQVISCVQNSCSNGGSCSLSSTQASIKQCDDGENFYKNQCLRFSANSMSWEQGEEFCRQQYRAKLFITETADDLRFLSNFFSTQSASINNSIAGIWLGIRAVQKDGSPQWAEYPSMYSVMQTFWRQGEPNIYPNYNQVCVALSTNSPEWISSLCSNRNLIVCARDVEPEAGTYLSQCQCANGFGGQTCEIQLDSGNDSSLFPATSTFCASNTRQPVELSCPNGAQIVVDYASYGITTGTTCDGRTKKHDCENVHSLQTLINKCEGQSACSIANLAALFPDTPCGVDNGGQLELQARWRCTAETQTTCAKRSIYFEGRCYEVNFQSKKDKQFDFKGAQDYCNQAGGTLLDADSPVDELNKLVAGKTKNKDSIFWVGLMVDRMGQGIWLDGTPASQEFSPSTCGVYEYFPSKGLQLSTLPCNSFASVICIHAPTSSSIRRPTQVHNSTDPLRPTVAPPVRLTPSAVFPDVWCAATKWRTIEFERTRACQTATVDCPDPENVVGTVTWRCDCQSGKWIGQPNSTDCTHKWVKTLEAAVARREPAEVLSNQLNQELGKTINDQLYGGDISGSVGASTNLVTLARSQFAALTDDMEKTTKSTNFTTNIGGAGDHLFSNPAQLVWAMLDPQQKVSLAARLMAVLQDSSLLWADYSNEADNKLQYTQWAVNVRVSRPQTLAPSMKTMSINGNADGATIQQSSSTLDDSGAFTMMNRPLPPGLVSGGYSKTKENVSFTGFSASPLISLPSLSTIQDSVSKTNKQRVMFAPMSFSPVMGTSATALDDTASVDSNSLKLAYFIFTALGDLLLTNPSEIINSQVIGAAVNDAEKSVALNENVTFNFPHLKTEGVTNARCVFWDIHQGNWSQDGCTLVSTSVSETVCSCNHLTSFAILMDVSGNVGRLSGGLANALDVVSSIGCAFSIVCLVLSLLVFTCFRSLYSLRNTIHRNLCLCLLIGELVFVIGIDRTGNKTGCSIVALILHYFFMAAFFWMLIEGYQLYMMLIQVFEPSSRRVILLVCLAYGTPAIIVAISAGIRWKDYGTESYCWLNTSSPTIWAFVAPVIVVITANIGFLLIALKVVLSVNATDRSRSDRVRGWLKGSATLLCLLGITWLFGFLTAVKGSGSTMVFAWIFTVLNCTQGIFIFILHVVMNDKVRGVVVRWLRSGGGSSAAEFNSKSYLSSRQRMMNMIRGGHSTPDTASTDDTKGAIHEIHEVTLPPAKAAELLRRLSASTSEETRDKGLAYRPSVNKAPKPIAQARAEGDTRSTDSSDPRVSMELDMDLAEDRPAVMRRKFPLGARESERGSKGHNGRKFRSPPISPSESKDDHTTAPNSAKSDDWEANKIIVDRF